MYQNRPQYNKHIALAAVENVYNTVLYHTECRSVRRR